MQTNLLTGFLKIFFIDEKHIVGTAGQWLVGAKVVIVVREMVDTPVVLAPVVEEGHHRVEQEEEEEKENERFLESHIEL